MLLRGAGFLVLGVGPAGIAVGIVDSSGFNKWYNPVSGKIWNLRTKRITIIKVFKENNAIEYNRTRAGIN